MSERQCRHPDIRIFDGLRCCLACGETVFETSRATETSELYSTSRSLYNYSPLNYKLGQEIRLLVLYPGEPADDLQCEIVHINLDDGPEYDAVSYTWASDDGDASFSRTINCGNSYISITASCDAALRQLRRRGLKRRLWLDAICINQTHIPERNHQVGFMDRIYSLARSVQICIQTSESFHHHAGQGFFDWLQDKRPNGTKYDMTWIQYKVDRLLNHRYFKRTWIIQEVALAKVVYLSVNAHECLLSRDVLDRLSHFANGKDHQLPRVLELRRAAEFQVFDNIFSCLLAGIESTCSDPRDNVFAVLSLLDPQVRSLIPVDYALDCGTVYANAVLAIIASGSSLEALANNGHAMRNPQSSSSADVLLDQFVRFLNFMDRQRREDDDALLASPTRTSKDTHFSQFHGDSIKRWRANVEFRIADDIGIAPDLSDEDAHVPVVMSRRPPSPAHSIWPRLQVRAHFIDTVHEGCLKLQEKSTVGQDGIIQLRPQQYRPGRYPNRDGSQLGLADWCNCIPGVSSSHGDVIPPSLAAFIEPALARGNKDCTFGTSMGVGFTLPNYEGDPSLHIQAGHEIWALDGAVVPYILLKTGHKTFQVLGDCWWWTALEQDSPNPGSRKVQQPLPYEKQTHVIEIHA